MPFVRHCCGIEIYAGKDFVKRTVLQRFCGQPQYFLSGKIGKGNGIVQIDSEQTAGHAVDDILVQGRELAQVHFVFTDPPAGLVQFLAEIARQSPTR